MATLGKVKTPITAHGKFMIALTTSVQEIIVLTITLGATMAPTTLRGETMTYTTSLGKVMIALTTSPEETIVLTTALGKAMTPRDPANTRTLTVTGLDRVVEPLRLVTFMTSVCRTDVP